MAAPSPRCFAAVSARYLQVPAQYPVACEQAFTMRPAPLPSAPMAVPSLPLRHIWPARQARALAEAAMYLVSQSMRSLYSGPTGCPVPHFDMSEPSGVYLQYFSYPSQKSCGESPGNMRSLPMFMVKQGFLGFGVPELASGVPLGPSVPAPPLPDEPPVSLPPPPAPALPDDPPLALPLLPPVSAPAPPVDDPDDPPLDEPDDPPLDEPDDPPLDEPDDPPLDEPDDPPLDEPDDPPLDEPDDPPDDPPRSGLVLPSPLAAGVHPIARRVERQRLANVRLFKIRAC
jgi:hypothetical protein